MTSERSTSQRILNAALDAFGTRGYEAVSLDDIAEIVGVTKQTILYWFESKDGLLRAVIEHAATEIAAVAEFAAVRSGDGFDGIEAVVKAVFRPAVRRPAVLGVIREMHRLGASATAPILDQRMGPLVTRAVAWLEGEMNRGRLRRADPALTLSLAYATVVGVATEPEALRAVGWSPTPAGLRALRRELIEFLRAALAAP